MELRVDVEKELKHFELDVSITCGDGEILAVVGPSGAGKTTLLRIIAGLEQPDRGVVRFGRAVWCDTSQHRQVPTPRRNLAFVFQNSLLFPHLTLEDNVGFAAKDQKDVPELLDRFGIGHLAKARPGQVSGGERQRGAFCQALAKRPGLLLLDEPFSALDPDTRTHLRRELKAIQQDKGISVVHITHDMGEARYLCDNILALERGRISDSWLENRDMGREYPVAGPAVVAA